MNHPPFVPSTKPSGKDTFSHFGAHRLAATIRAAWAKCGHDVPVHVVETMPGFPNTNYTVRMPTLINGLPYP